MTEPTFEPLLSITRAIVDELASLMAALPFFVPP